MSLISKAKAAVKKITSAFTSGGGSRNLATPITSINPAVFSPRPASTPARTSSSSTSFPMSRASDAIGPIRQSIAPNMTVAPSGNDPGGPGFILNGRMTSINNPAYISAQNQGLDVARGASPIYSAPTTLRAGSSMNSTEEMFGSDFSSASRTMNAMSIAPTPSAISVPSAPGYANPGAINNGGLVAALTDAGFVYDPATNSFGTPPKPEVSTEEQRRISEQQKLMDMIPEKDNVLDDPVVRQQQEEVNRRKQEVANYTSQLNSVVAQQNADLLRLRGLGAQEGVTETVYGGQAATINREAAIKALPIQAQVAAAQGNLDLAQDYLTQLTTWKAEEINNRYDYKKTLYASISEFVKGEQKNRLDALEKKNDREWDIAKMNLSIQDSLVKESAKDNPAAVARISALNPSSPTFRSDMANILAQTGMSTTGISEVASENLKAYASQFADTGKLPSPAELKLAGLSVGQVSEFARQIPKQSGALVSTKTGVKSSALSPTQEDGILALYDISQKTEQLKELEKKRVKGLTSAAVGKVFGSKDQENYLALREEIIDLLARARTGAALTSQEEAFYKSQLPGRVGNVGFIFGQDTQNRLNNFESKINGTLKTRLNGQDMAIYGYSTVKVGGEDRTVGEVLEINGAQYRVLPDGTLTDVF